jgi:choline transport protein
MEKETQKNYAVERSNSEHEGDGFQLRSATELGGTDADEHDMRMLGRMQQLNVQISQVSRSSHVSY